LAVYSNEFILDTVSIAHAWAQKIIARQKKSLQICCLVFNTNLLYQDFGRRRTEITHHQRVGRSESHSYWQCC